MDILAVLLISIVVIPVVYALYTTIGSNTGESRRPSSAVDRSASKKNYLKEAGMVAAGGIGCLFAGIAICIVLVVFLSLLASGFYDMIRGILALIPIAILVLVVAVIVKIFRR